MRFYDLTLPITPDMVIYPGNPPVIFTSHQSMPAQSSNSTQISLGTHTGTHFDAPLHAINDGSSIDQISLEQCIGPCQVLDFSSEKDKITIDLLKPYQIQSGEKILLKTHNSLRGWDSFYSDYVYLDGDAAEYLADLSVGLVGIDYFSIKQRGSSDHRPHTALLSRNIPIIEALNLKDVPAGEYFLIALPLNLKGLDGSPARVILTDINPE